MRITYLVYQFPQLSETYACTEIRNLSRDHEIDIISLTDPEVLDPAEPEVFVSSDEEAIFERARAFAPDVLHTHWLGPQLSQACALAKRLDIPMTVRAHSFDVLWNRPGRRWKGFGPRKPDRSKPIKENLDFLKSEACRGILTFPFSVERLIGAGIPEKKLVPCWPVVDFERFHDETPNGRGVLNGGALLPKKDFGAYLEFARRVPEQRFSLYPIGKDMTELVRANRALGEPVSMHAPVSHREMPAVYKQHDWLVYTADPKLRTVGWPVCAMEAMAAGVGVCMPNLRPDLKDYVGDAGFVYDSFDEVAEWIRRPVPDDRRKAGFEQARKADVRRHIGRLTDLWQGLGA